MADGRLPTLGEKVKELRREQGLDQRGLADLVKRSVSWVSQVERGEIAIGDVGMLQRLAVAPSVPSRELVELVLGEDAGELERQRPYVEVLRLALAGHPAPEAALGMPTKSRARLTTEHLEARLLSLHWAAPSTSAAVPNAAPGSRPENVPAFPDTTS